MIAKRSGSAQAAPAAVVIDSLKKACLLRRVIVKYDEPNTEQD